MTKHKAQPAPVAAAKATTQNYPLHMKPRVIDGKTIADQFDPCGTTGVLVLMEQTRREPDGNRLFCLRCNTDVTATAAEHAQAFAAAHAEGWRPPTPRVLPATPGDLSGETRRQLLGLLRLESDENSKNKEDADTKGATGHALGYVEGIGRGTLTVSGREMALCIESPEVPAGVARFANDAGYLKSYAKRAKEPKARKARAVEPSAPMVCNCGHGVTSHTSTSARDVGSACRETGCKCKRYAQVKPEKVTKPKKTKAA